MDSITRTRINELRNEIDQEWALSCRREYLSDRMAENLVEWWYERSCHSDYVARGRLIEDMMTQEAMHSIVKKILKDMHELFYRRQIMSGQQIGVTGDEIQRAKEHPFEDLLPVVRGRVRCPFHDDKNPSASVKDNKLHCFVCNRTWDTIDYWAEKNGRSFADAVRALQ